ncbi:MAG: response regulator [Candidatus Cloacimonetes bacterium]|nr:response regulator [Candidatus Cloacimonadota bacterium]
MKSNKPILVIDDDVIDSMTVKRAIKDCNYTNRVDFARNGEEAFAYLNNEENEKPCIILLDLNMPKMNGIEFLEILKKNERLKRIPVIILTTSRSDQDRLKAYNLGVAGYMIKSMDYSEFVEVMKTIKSYWSISELPE